MVELFRIHGTDDGDIIHNSSRIRQKLAHPGPIAADLLELVGRTQHLRHAFYEREPLALHERFRAGLHIQLNQLGLIVEHIQSRRRAGHVQVDDGLGARWERRELWGVRRSAFGVRR